MKTVLAAIDESPAAQPVLATALRVADLLGADAEAVHVREHDGRQALALAEQNGVILEVLDGPVAPTLLTAFHQPRVVAAVVGARGTSAGRQPAGHTVLELVESVRKPVVVVPPDAPGAAGDPIRRLLAPLEGTVESAVPVATGLAELIDSEVELVVLHVFTATSVPGALDDPARDLAIWGDEFIARFCPRADRILLRTGPVGLRVTDVCRDDDIDLIVLSWSQNVTPGHAEVVRHVLATSAVPVLLLPVE